MLAIITFSSKYPKAEKFGNKVKKYEHGHPVANPTGT